MDKSVKYLVDKVATRLRSGETFNFSCKQVFDSHKIPLEDRRLLSRKISSALRARCKKRKVSVFFRENLDRLCTDAADQEIAEAVRDGKVDPEEAQELGLPVKDLVRVVRQISGPGPEPVVRPVVRGLKARRADEPLPLFG